MKFRKYEEFTTEIQKYKIPMAEAEFAKSVNTPYGCYFRSADDVIHANGEPIYSITTIVVELYTERDDNQSERDFEQWLKDKDISFRKTERAYIESEKYYQTIYEIELMFDE